MNVTVVIPALDAASTLRAQLAALDRQIGAPHFDVIVVDNGSTDGTGELAALFDSHLYEITVVLEPTRGINSARNAGIAAAPDGAVLLCDADDEVWPEWVAEMTTALQPARWVGGRLDYTRLNSARVRTVWGAAERSTYRSEEPYVDTTYGCNCGFWRSMWESVGRFDSSISGTGGDETEFFMRAWGAGFTRVDAPDAIVSYRLRAGGRAALRQRFRQGRNQVLLRTMAGGRLLPGSLTRGGTWRALGYRMLAVPKYLWTSSSRWAWATSIALHLGRLSGFRRVAATGVVPAPAPELGAETTVRCRCCAGALGHVFAVPSWRSPEWATFRYGECAVCGSLTLIDEVDAAPFIMDDAVPAQSGEHESGDRSLTTLDDPLAELCSVCARLAGGGPAVRFTVPVAQGPVWAEYRDNWMALDAPVQRFVPTRQGLELLVARAGLAITAVHPHNDAEHVVGSELIARRIRPWVQPSTVMGERELAHLTAAAARLRSAKDCPEMSIVLRVGGQS